MIKDSLFLQWRKWERFSITIFKVNTLLQYVHLLEKENKTKFYGSDLLFLSRPPGQPFSFSRSLVSTLPLFRMFGIVSVFKKDMLPFAPHKQKMRQLLNVKFEGNYTHAFRCFIVILIIFLWTFIFKCTTPKMERTYQLILTVTAFVCFLLVGKQYIITGVVILCACLF